MLSAGAYAQNAEQSTEKKHVCTEACDHGEAAVKPAKACCSEGKAEAKSCAHDAKSADKKSCCSSAEASAKSCDHKGEGHGPKHGEGEGHGHGKAMKAEKKSCCSEKKEGECKH